MAYQFTAEKCGNHDLPILHERLARHVLIEFFPVEIGDDCLTLGISVPIKALDDPRFETELVNVMTYLVSEEEFQVTDLYTGDPVRVDDIPRLASQIYS